MITLSRVMSSVGYIFVPGMFFYLQYLPSISLAQPVTFTTPMEFSAGYNTGVSVAGDFNGDHLMDLAVAHPGTGMISILLGTGSGQFQPATHFPIATGTPDSMDVGDVNGDGRLDLVLASSSTNSVVLLIGTGAGGFALSTQIFGPVGLNLNSVAIADLNGDGSQDMVVAGAGGVGILLGTGGGTFAPMSTSGWITPPGLFSIAIGDFNRDGLPDIVIGNSTFPFVTAQLGDGLGSFGIPKTSSTPIVPKSVKVGDFNGDGQTDVAVVGLPWGSPYPFGSVVVMLGDGNGTFPTGSQWGPACFSPTAVAIGDFNRDRKLDVVASCAGWGLIPDSNVVLWVVGDSSGGFTDTGSMLVVGQPQYVTIGDFALDGKPDLVVSTGFRNTIAVLLNTSIVVLPPVANAGVDQSVHVGMNVTLDGSASSDPAGLYPLTYAWTITSRPIGSSATLSGGDTVSPGFIADAPGDFIINLVVTNANGVESIADSVVVSTTNTQPVAAAGPDQAVTLLNSIVQLDGSGSYDDDGNPLSYNWSFNSVPSDSAAALSNPNSPTPTFVADVYGEYEINLVVNDGWSTSDPDTMVVSFANVKPVANAGSNQSVNVGDMALLNGSDSTDPNGDELTYRWSFVSIPANSVAVLNNTDTATADFVADADGTYVVSLVVNDGLLDSEPSNVTVVATSSPSAAISALRFALEVIYGLSTQSFKNPDMPNALTNKINAAIDLINQGRYQEALDKLQHDVLSKTNGCAISGSPDANDWIKDCVSQGQTYPVIEDAIVMLLKMV